MKKNGLINIIVGIILGGASIFFFLSFFSYLFVGNEDCRITDKTIFDLLKKHEDIKNYCGVLGAKVSYLFMFRGIGASAFVLVFFMFFLYCKILKLSIVKEYGIFKAFVLSILVIISSSLLLWFFFEKCQYKQLSNCVGQMTKTLGEMCVFYFGRGTYIFIFIFALLVLSLLFEKNIFIGCIMITTFLFKKIFFIFYSFILKIKKIKNTPTENKIGINDIFTKNENIFGGNNTDDNFNISRDYGFLILNEKNIKTYKKPTLDLLEDYENLFNISEREINENIDKIKLTFSAFKINATFCNTTVGATMTLYEFRPNLDIKVSSIKGLEDNLSLSLSTNIRIIAPIPGRNTIGIEIPNKEKKILSLKSILESDEFQNTKFKLPIVLGKDVFNKNIIVDLSKLPHIIVAGATGQGKSIGLNVMIMSLLYCKTPNEFNFILIDPKKVEFSLFETISEYFIAKTSLSKEAIIVDLDKCIDIFNILCSEMDSRYNLLNKHFVKNIEEFNCLENVNKKMQYIVVIIDEFSDLMIKIGKQIELKIIRLAQLSRAVGIHIIISTQRPSADVITGNIKTNFPARISYKVSSKVDSMIILNSCGAETLLGNGDSLVSINSNIFRVQSPYISTEEIKKVCDFIKTQNK